MADATGGWPYPTVPVDGNATIDEDGDNQTCECGNDSLVEDWRSADRSGRLSFAASGSFDPAEFAVCPSCGRVYPNAALFDTGSGPVAAIARYDLSSPTFIAALAWYDHEAYGAQRPAASAADYESTAVAAARLRIRPFQASVHAQDPSVGRVGVVLDALADASEQAGAYEYVDIAVAYASAEGVRLLDDRLSSGTWARARKRFLVSMDFGFTQPRALARLCELENAEVRIPNGRAVLESRSLRPPSAFHAKVFAFRGEAWHELRTLVVGSSNLTASALSTGAEVVTKQIWSSPGAPGSWQHLLLAKPLLEWFNDTWETADLLEDVLDEYRSQYRALPKPQRLREDKTPTTRRYLASSDGHVISGTLPVQLAAARSLWVDGASIIRNREPRAGNQLNTPRGTRVFFGFGSENVARDTTLGRVEIRVAGHPYVERSIRFANNSMDIIGLPIPEQYGLDGYQDTILVFTRDTPSGTGQGRFTLTVTDAAGLTARKNAAANSVELSMHSGRQYGLLF